MNQTKSAEMGFSWDREGSGPHKPIIYSKRTVESFPLAKKKETPSRERSWNYFGNAGTLSETNFPSVWVSLFLCLVEVLFSPRLTLCAGFSPESLKKPPVPDTPNEDLMQIHHLPQLQPYRTSFSPSLHTTFPQMSVILGSLHAQKFNLSCLRGELIIKMFISFSLF